MDTRRKNRARSPEGDDDDQATVGPVILAGDCEVLPAGQLPRPATSRLPVTAELAARGAPPPCRLRPPSSATFTARRPGPG
ncbi:unnamed protein product [Lampetra planeri]